MQYKNYLKYIFTSTIKLFRISDNSNKKKCILYGNCQATVYLYNKLIITPHFYNLYEIISYVNHDRDQVKKLKVIDIYELKNCDLFIYQPLAESHGVYSTNNILKFIKNTCIKISFPYLYNSSFYTVYFEDASTRWTTETLVNCGWKNIILLINRGSTLNKILNLFDEGKLDFYFQERFNICLELLKEKEKNCTIKVSNFILSNYLKKRLFLTQNHPSDFLNTFIINEILDHIGLKKIPNKYYLERSIESFCSYDLYNNKILAHGFSINNEITKQKIINFYEYFKAKKLSPRDLILKGINGDPEKFIDMPF